MLNTGLAWRQARLAWHMRCVKLLCTEQAGKLSCNDANAQEGHPAETVLEKAGALREAAEMTARHGCMLFTP